MYFIGITDYQTIIDCNEPLNLKIIESIYNLQIFSFDYVFEKIMKQF